MAYLYRAFGHVETDQARLSFLPALPIVTIMVDALPILRTTPTGAWILSPTTGKEVWVSTTGRKRFACPTKEEAIESLKQRNKRHRVHLGNALSKAEAIRDAFEKPLVLEDLVNGCYQLSP